MTPIDIARYSAWLVVALFVGSIVLEIRFAAPSMTRRLWTAGVVALLAHVAWTILAIHRASVRNAYDHTAAQTNELIGVPIGAGVFVNFAMPLVWLADALAWWLIADWGARRRRYAVTLYGIFGFLFFNAAVVFASPWGRTVGLVACGLIAGAWLMPKRQSPTQNGQSP